MEYCIYMLNNIAFSVVMPLFREYKFQLGKLIHVILDGIHRKYLNSGGTLSIQSVNLQLRYFKTGLTFKFQRIFLLL